MKYGAFALYFVKEEGFSFCVLNGPGPGENRNVKSPFSEKWCSIIGLVASSHLSIYNVLKSILL